MYKTRRFLKILLSEWFKFVLSSIYRTNGGWAQVLKKLSAIVDSMKLLHTRDCALTLGN